MLKFGEYIQNKAECFVTDGICVLIEPVPIGIFERHIIGVDSNEHAGMIKYRVTFKYPRSAKAAAGKSYEDGVKYILAESPQDARKRVEEFIRNSKMKKIAGVSSDQPLPYLKNLKTRDMAIKVKAVDTWDDFVSLCTYVAQKRITNPIRFFDQHDLSLFLRKYRRSANFAKELEQLPKAVQLVMKRVYFHVTQGDLSHDNTTELQKSAKKAAHLTTHQVVNKHAKELGKRFPKPEMKDLYEDPPSMGSVAEVIATSKAYGIPYKELKDHKNQLAHEHDPMFDQKVRAYKDIKQRLQRANLAYQTNVHMRQNLNPSSFGKGTQYQGKGGITARNKMFDGQDEKQWDKFGADEWATELEEEYPWLNSQENIYNFYMAGPPKMASPLELWSGALQRAVETKRQEMEYQSQSGQKEYIPSNEPIPF